MDPKKHTESSIVARLIVAAVALSSLAAGTTIVGSVIEVAGGVPAPQIVSSDAWSARPVI